MPKPELRNVVENQRVNAALTWVLVAFLTTMAAAAGVEGDLLWTGFVAALVVLAVVPAAAYRSVEAMLPWEVLLLASLPVVGRVVVVGEQVGGVMLTGRVATYLGVAAVALIIAVELDVFSSVRMNHTFAILFVVIATMAAAGVWALVQWLTDVFLGTTFLLDGRPEGVIETALMWDFVAATAAGVGAGLLFEYYFRRRARADKRVPDEIEGTI